MHNQRTSSGDLGEPLVERSQRQVERAGHAPALPLRFAPYVEHHGVVTPQLSRDLRQRERRDRLQMSLEDAPGLDRLGAKISRDPIEADAGEIAGQLVD